MKPYLTLLAAALFVLARVVTSMPQPGSSDARALPHRSLREIDIQGHQAATSSDPCPGQHRENVPDSGLLLYCWGRKP
jgi:hypothetical protein